MTEQGRRRLARVFSVFVCAMMLTGLVVLTPESAEAYPLDAWIVGNVTDGVNPVENVYTKAMIFMGGSLDVNWAVTDANGSYSMMVTGGLTYIVFAANGSYYMEMNTVTISPGETKVANFTLTHIVETADVTISGYVTDEFGNPRSDGHVLGIVNNPIGGDMPYYANVTKADPSTGYYEVKVIPGARGGGAIGMDFAGYPMAENTTTNPLNASMSYTFNIELKPQTYTDNAMVYGYVTKVESGDPLPSAVVSYEWGNETEYYTNWTMTNETGYYEMGVHSGDNLRLTFQKIGFTIKFFEVDVLPAEAVQQDAALRQCNAKISGNVTDEDTGSPIAFARVFLVDNPNMQENISMATTDNAGRYELNAFDGTGLYLGADQEGYIRNFTLVNVTPGAELWYDLTLKAISAWLVGQVTDALSGAPIGGVWVHVFGPLYDDYRQTDMMGMYNFSLVAGDYTIEAGRGDYKVFNATITVIDGIENVFNFSLIPWQNALLKGQVYDLITGEPVSNATIMLGGWWGNWTKSNETGYYELYNVDGAYTLNVDAPGYQYYSEEIILLELNVTVRDIGLMPQNPEQTTLLHGYVSDAGNSSPIAGAEVRARLVGGGYENGTVTNMSGYYEMYVPPWLLDVQVNASAHGPYFDQVNVSGISDFVLDAALPSDPYGPNMTYSQSPLENISWTNPSMIEIMFEELYPREMAVIFFMEWNSSGLNSNWSLVQYQRTSFDPWNPQSDLPYSTENGTYWVNMTWFAWGLGGMLQNGTAEPAYFPASVWNWYVEPVFVVAGFYSNATSPRMEGAAMFNTSTGDFMGFWPYGMMSPVVAPDPTGVFEPEDFVIEYVGGVFTRAEWRTLGAWDVNGLKFISMTGLLSGRYKTEFYINDWGNQGNGFLNDVTVDNEAPIADAGPDQDVIENAPVTLDGTNSTDNMGIASYVWQFYNATGVWTVLSGSVVVYSFELAGSYEITLVVTDGAWHQSMATMFVNVTADARPIANAGPDQTVNEDTVVAFNGNASWDDNGIVNYTWNIVELSVVLFDVGPQYTFSEPGVYHVELTVMDTVGQLSDPDEMNVTVNDTTPPKVDAGPDQVVPDGADVVFNGSNSTDNVGIVSYVWSFFDIVPRELYGIVANHTFSAIGTYIVTLNVSDAAGNWATDDLRVDVLVDVKPIANAGPNQTVNENTLVTFDGSASWDDKGIDNYTWTILNLSVVMYDVAPTYTFFDPGVYHVWLVVIDTIGQASDPDEMIVTVNDTTPPEPNAGIDQTVNNGTPVTFNGSESTDNGVILYYNWTFTDGMPIELHGKVVDYTFSSPGFYNVVLNVTDAGGNWATDDLWVTVNGPPIAEAGGDEFLYAGDWAWFSGWGSSDDIDPNWAMEYTWTFVYAGSPVELTGIDQSFQFIVTGVYTVSLTVRDSGGLESYDSLVVAVVQPASAWWVDPVTGETLVDGATISCDYAILRGYVDPDAEVDIATPTETYQVYADSWGYFEVNSVNLSEGLNVVTVMTYSSWWGSVMTWYKMISSDTHCLLWVDSVESPTVMPLAHISGFTDTDAQVTVNGMPATVAFDGTFGVDVALSEGPNTVNVTAVDSVGNLNWAELVVMLDTTPPSLTILEPSPGANLSEPNVLVDGTVESGATVLVNGVLAAGGTDWSATVALVEGANTIVVTATDAVGNTATQTVTVSYVPPVYVTPEELAAVRAELMGEISNLSAALQANVDDLLAQINSTMDAILALQASLDANVAALQAQIDAAVNDTAALNASVAENLTSVVENLTALQGNITAAMADIVELQVYLQENSTALWARITDAMAGIAALEANLTNNVTALDSLIDALDQDIATIGTELAAVNSTLRSAQNQTSQAINSMQAALADLQRQIDQLNQSTQQDITDVEKKASDTNSFASMLMYLTLILFAIAVVMVGLVWYMASKRFGQGGAGARAESLEEVEEGPSEVEREFESLEKEIKDEEL